MNIGKAIKYLRKKHELNQQQLAKEAGLTQTALSQFESGARRPNAQSLKKLTDFFKVPEIVIYMLATEVNDVPDAKKEMFEKIFPNMQNLLISLFE